MKPAWSRTSTGFLPQASANARAVAIVSSLVVIARTTSTSAIIGAGLKKWMPHTSSGRPVSMAISTTGSVDVFVARIPPSATMRSSSLKRCFLVGRSSTIDSITRSQSARAPRSDTAVDPAEHGGALGVLELAPLHLLGERLLEAGDHRVGGRLRAAPQHHLGARLGGDLGDAAAHDPRTDDSDPLGHSRAAPRGWKGRRLPIGRSGSPRGRS